jgi:NAD(P) transhydrogenase subunit alpha
MICLLFAQNHPAILRRLAARISPRSPWKLAAHDGGASDGRAGFAGTAAGYRAVIAAANALAKFFPMLMTPAGTIAPARVLVVGAGVAGLQAIATARRLGAVVEAFDVRAEVREEVESLGAKFVAAEFDETVETQEGYARQLSEAAERLARAAIERVLLNADVCITTALVPNRRAPVLLTAAMVQRMRPGSVIVDLAARGEIAS